MASPQLTISPEPLESDAVVYLPLAPKALGETANGQVSLSIVIRNNESQPVRVNQLMVRLDHPQISPFVKTLLGHSPSGGRGLLF